jgi:hypothetical protein
MISGQKDLCGQRVHAKAVHVLCVAVFAHTYFQFIRLSRTKCDENKWLFLVAAHSQEYQLCLIWGGRPKEAARHMGRNYMLRC